MYLFKNVFFINMHFGYKYLGAPKDYCCDLVVFGDLLDSTFYNKTVKCPKRYLFPINKLNYVKLMQKNILNINLYVYY
jgi:hypothetical protein